MLADPGSVFTKVILSPLLPILNPVPASSITLSVELGLVPVNTIFSSSVLSPSAADIPKLLATKFNFPSPEPLSL